MPISSSGEAAGQERALCVTALLYTVRTSQLQRGLVLERGIAALDGALTPRKRGGSVGELACLASVLAPGRRLCYRDDYAPLK